MQAFSDTKSGAAVVTLGTPGVRLSLLKDLSHKVSFGKVSSKSPSVEPLFQFLSSL